MTNPTSDVAQGFKGWTPKKRKIASSLPSYDKKNLVQAVVTVREASAEDTAQCVISGASENRTVIEFSHVLNASTSVQDIQRFEWSWGMDYCSLNVHTRSNIQTLSVDLHWLFDAAKDNKPTGWFWVPTIDNIGLLSLMHNYYVGSEIINEKAGMTSNKRCDPKEFYGKSTKFSYRFISFPEMNESWSIRRYTSELRGPLDPNLIQNAIYPFDDLPNFELHIPYHFVIINTGKKLFQKYHLGEIDFENDFTFLKGTQHFLTRTIMRILRNIYVAWTFATPDSKWLTGELYNEANEQPPFDRTHQGGAGSESGGQSQGRSSGSKGGSTQAQNMGADPSGGQMGRRHATAESLAPWDSASCTEPLRLVDETQQRSDDEDMPFVDDEEDEYEDEEFFDSLKQWANNVWSSMRRGTGSDLEGTMVGEAEGHTLSKGINTATSPLLPKNQLLPGY